MGHSAPLPGGNKIGLSAAATGVIFIVLPKTLIIASFYITLPTKKNIFTVISKFFS